MRRACSTFLATALFGSVTTAAFAATEARPVDWRIVYSNAERIVLFDANTIAIDKAIRSFNIEMYYLSDDKQDVVGYAYAMQADCKRHLIKDVTATGISPDGTRHFDKTLRQGFASVTEKSVDALLYRFMCGLKPPATHPDGYDIHVAPIAAARSFFALQKIGLTIEQAVDLVRPDYSGEDMLESWFDAWKVDAAKRPAARLALAAQTEQPPPPPPPIVPLASAVATGRVGQYVHSEMEMASGIWLKADGSFDYGLTVGSLDETAHGRWTVEGDRVRMVNEPRVIAPTITAGSARADPKVALSVTVVTPAGRGVEGVDIAIDFDRGATEQAYTQTDGWTLPATDKRRARFVTLSMSSYGLQSPRFPVANGANALTFVLTPNDFGVVDFTGVEVTIDKEDLVVRRQGSEMRYARRAK